MTYFHVVFSESEGECLFVGLGVDGTLVLIRILKTRCVRMYTVIVSWDRL
jgi:hypothetical protein